MTTLRYNPLTYSEKLKQSGLSEGSANVIAQEQAEIYEDIKKHNEELRKTDSHILNAIADLKNEVINFKNEMRSEIKALELKMTIKFGGMMVIGVGVLTFFLKHT